MGLNERCSALVAVLVLLLLLDSSCAQPPKKPVHKKQKPITDPHYRHYKQYAGSSDGYGGYAQAYGSQPAYKQYGDGYKPTQKAYKDEAECYKQYDEKYDYGYDSKYSKQYGKYDDDKKKKRKKVVLPELSATVKFIVDACSGKYPAIDLTTDTTGDRIQPTTVAGWWRLSCKRYTKQKSDDWYGYDDYGYEAGSRAAATAAAASVADAKNATGRTASYDESYYDGSYDAYGSEGYGAGPMDTVQNVGFCDFVGNTKSGISHSEGATECYIAKVILSCSFNDDVRKCHPGLAPLTDADAVDFTASGDLTATYEGNDRSFSFSLAPSPPSGFPLLVNAFLNGRAGLPGTGTDALPLTRFNTGKVTTLSLSHCEALNRNESLPLAYDDTTGGGYFGVLFTN